MKTKTIIAASVAAVALIGSLSWSDSKNQIIQRTNEVINQVVKKFDEFNTRLPEDRVYLHLDKSFYEPGETIWFAAYIRNGSNLKPSEVSDIVHVELINPKGAIEKEIRLISRNGKTLGDFSLDSEASGGVYKIKAYTNWQRNDSAFFEKEIQVQNVILPRLKMKLDFEKKAFGAGDEVVAKLNVQTNENLPLSNKKVKVVANLKGEKFFDGEAFTDAAGMRFIKFNLPGNLTTADGLLNILIDYEGQTEAISRAIPIVMNNIKIQLLPEGGDLVNGLESRVALRAVNEFGKPADVEGVVLNEKGKEVVSFKSFHQGMGEFKIIPAEGEKYVVTITRPEGIEEKFQLPDALPRGYVMSADNSSKNELYLQIGTTESEELSLVMQVRGKLIYSTAILAKPGYNHLVIPVNDFPIGVTQITLFDSKGIPRAERLTFVNKQKQLNIAIETNKEKYLPREKVKMTILVKDERGLPMPASLSLSVVNDQLLSFADDKTGNILSRLLLEPDVKEKIEESAFYFKKDEPKADKALDLLLMTSGWRRYSWEKVLDGDLPAITFNGEKAIIAGEVRDGYTGKPIEKAVIRISHDSSMVMTGADGKYRLNRVDLSNQTSLLISADSYSQGNYKINDYNQSMIYYLYPRNYYPRYNKSAMKRVPAAAPAEELFEDINVRGGGMDMLVPEIAEAEQAAQKKAEGKMAFAQQNKDDLAKMKAMTESTSISKKEGATKIVVADFRERRSMDKNRVTRDESQIKNNVLYYRAKEFASPLYKENATPDVRTDFRSTIFWKGNVEVGRTGKKTVEFCSSDEITSFRATVEGIATDGTIGRTEKTIFSQLPFAMTIKAPVEVVTEDRVSIPLTLKNNTDAAVTGLLSIKTPKGLISLKAIPELQILAAGKTKTIFLDYRVTSEKNDDGFEVSFIACGLRDAFSQKLKIVSKGFPVSASFSGNEKEGKYEINLANVVKGSIHAKLTAFPSVVSDLMTGVDGILREPSGCFEQTSMSSYPNAMVMDYLRTTETKDEKLLAYAGSLLDKGYKKLAAFETPEKGYEWFGQAPGHEGLTAFGLMQFNDLKKVYDGVDDKMVDRTANWLLSHRDGKGGFSRNKRALHSFGMISEDIMNGYIVYALAEAGYANLQKEMDASYERAVAMKDPYLLAMAANALFKQNDKRADKVMDILSRKQEQDGSFNGISHSITYSTGQSLRIETTSLAIMAMLKSPHPDRNALNKAVEFLVKSRSGYGTFGNTQGTVLALKSLTEFAKATKKTPEDGTIEFYVDGKKAGEKSYKAGEKEPIMFNNLEEFIKEGKHELRVKYAGGVENPLPYSLSVDWNTFLPENANDCKVGLKTTLGAKTVNQGETVRMKVVLTNKTTEGLPSPIAIVGIPAGLSVQPWQLKELQEKKVFDYYEVTGNNVVFYYRAMAPSETKEINLDLKADIPGEYEAPASSAYLYYTNEFKSWDGGDRINVNSGV